MLRILVDDSNLAHAESLGDEVATLAASLGQVFRQVERDPVDMLLSDDLDALLSDDQQLYCAALNVGIDPERVLSLADGHRWLRTLTGHPLAPPEPVHSEPLTALRERDPLIAGLLNDGALCEWIDEARDAGGWFWSHSTGQGSYAGVVAARPRAATLELGLLVTARTASRWWSGDLLIQAVVDAMRSRGFSNARVALPHRDSQAVALLQNAGFIQVGAELVKELQPGAIAPLEPLEYHQRYGPAAVDLSLAPVFIAPITSTLHRRLFLQPDTQLRLPLGVEAPSEPVAPALRKGLLSRSNIRQLPRGATLLLYRSADVRAITAVGVVEETLRSSDPTLLARWLGPRTPHSLRELSELARRRPLAIHFRQALILREPISRSDLIVNEVLKRAPSSITQVKGRRALRWLRERLGDESGLFT